METFKHRTLGEFKRIEEFDESWWRGSLDLPAFAAFRYLPNGKQQRRSKVPVEIFGEPPPSKPAMKVLSSIRTSQKRLVVDICKTFFRDLHQQGYDDLSAELEGFGMWWSRDPVSVALSCREALLKRRKRDHMWEPEDLFAVLYEPRIRIHPDLGEPDGPPHTVIQMGAEFEEEHGVGVVTDGKRVIGLGYADDV